MWNECLSHAVCDMHYTVCVMPKILVVHGKVPRSTALNHEEKTSRFRGYPNFDVSDDKTTNDSN